MIAVKRREDEPFEKFLRRFNREVKDSKLFTELKEKSYFRTRRQKRRLAIRRNKNRRQKETNNEMVARDNFMEKTWQEIY